MQLLINSQSKAKICKIYSSKLISIFEAYFLLGFTFVDNSFQDLFECLLTFHKKTEFIHSNICKFKYSIMLVIFN